MKTVYLIIGTRPDAIKMAPVYHALKALPSLQVKLVSTGQHRDLLEDTYQVFNLRPDITLDIQRTSPSLTSLAAEILQRMDQHFTQAKPDLVLGHGDTSTCYAAAIASFYHRVPFYHVEAGLRSHQLDSPFPEEFHRRTISCMAAHHFVPTEVEKVNLLQEGISESAITITGNTIHDAIESVDYRNDSYFQLSRSGQYNKIVAITMHRRENNEHLHSILTSIKNIASQQKQCMFVYPLHPNPFIRKVSGEVFQDIDNVVLTTPLDYRQFISLLHRSDLILTDSGGVQEEAAYLGKTAFILRNHTERKDGFTQGSVKLIGTNPQLIETAVTSFLQAVPQRAMRITPIKQRQTASSMIADTIARGCQ